MSRAHRQQQHQRRRRHTALVRCSPVPLVPSRPTAVEHRTRSPSTPAALDSSRSSPARLRARRPRGPSANRADRAPSPTRIPCTRAHTHAHKLGVRSRRAPLRVLCRSCSAPVFGGPSWHEHRARGRAAISASCFPSAVSAVCCVCCV